MVGEEGLTDYEAAEKDLDMCITCRNLCVLCPHCHQCPTTFPALLDIDPPVFIWHSFLHLPSFLKAIKEKVVTSYNNLKRTDKRCLTFSFSQKSQ